MSSHSTRMNHPTAPHRRTELSSQMWVDKNAVLGDSYFRLTDSRASRTHLSFPGGSWCGPNLSSSEVTGVCRGPVLPLKLTCQTLGRLTRGPLPTAEPSTHSERGAGCHTHTVELDKCGLCQSSGSHTDPVYPFSWPCTKKAFGLVSTWVLFPKIIQHKWRNIYK